MENKNEFQNYNLKFIRVLYHLFIKCVDKKSIK